MGFLIGRQIFLCGIFLQILLLGFSCEVIAALEVMFFRICGCAGTDQEVIEFRFGERLCNGCRRTIAFEVCHRPEAHCHAVHISGIKCHMSIFIRKTAIADAAEERIVFDILASRQGSIACCSMILQKFCSLCSTIQGELPGTYNRPVFHQ